MYPSHRLALWSSTPEPGDRKQGLDPEQAAARGSSLLGERYVCRDRSAAKYLAVSAQDIRRGIVGRESGEEALDLGREELRSEYVRDVLLIG